MQKISFQTDDDGVFHGYTVASYSLDTNTQELTIETNKLNTSIRIPPDAAVLLAADGPLRAVPAPAAMARFNVSRPAHLSMV